MEKEHPGGKLRKEGPGALSDSELLSIIIGSGFKGSSAENISKNLISCYGSIDQISGVTLSELMRIKGIGVKKATQLAAIFEIIKRILRNLGGE